MTNDELIQTGPGSIRWESVHAEAEAALLPEALREPYVWLKSFTAQECNKDVDLLTEAFKKVGVNRDKTTWTKLLKGRYNRNAEGRETASPLIKERDLLQDIEALRTQTRKEALQGKVPFVETETWHTISDFIDTRRDTMRVNKFGIVVGVTGSQKTACFKEYCRRHNHGTCVWMEAPENGSLSEFQTVLADKYNISRNRGWTEKRNGIFANVNAKKTIIVDNTQDLWKPALKHNQPAFAFLRRLQDETSCTIILSITPTFEKELINSMMKGYFEQFEGRAGGRRNFLRLAEHASRAEVIEIAKKLGMSDATKHADALMLVAQQPGRVRHLFEVLQDAKAEADATGEKFAFKHVEEVLR